MNLCSRNHEEISYEAKHWSTRCPICELLGAEQDKIAELTKELEEAHTAIYQLREQLAGVI